MASELVFPEDKGPLCGWDSAVVKRENVSDEAVARELVQNALDAGLPGLPVTVDFYHLSLPQGQIPYIEEYTNAFTTARKTLADKKGTTSEHVIARIEKVLGDRTIDCLVCVDHGVGLTRETLQTLYGEGVTDKPDKGRGSVGHGHLTAFAPSNLRYMLYAGRNRESGTPVNVFGGHTILATQSTGTAEGYAQHSSDGFICDAEQPKEFVREMQAAPDVPELLNKYLPDQSGSVVLLCGYEPLKESQNGLSIADHTLGAIAKNFMVAIKQRELVATYRRYNDTLVCDAESLESILKKLNYQKPRARGIAGPLGTVAYDLWDTLVGSHPTELQGVLDGVTLWLRQLPTGETRTRVAVHREGMWITDDVLGLVDFGDRVPFSAVVNLTDTGPGCLADLVREAEGASHLEIRPRSLTDDGRRKQLQDQIQKLHQEIANRVEARETESYTPDEFRLFDITSVGHVTPTPRPKYKPTDLSDEPDDAETPDEEDSEDSTDGGQPGKGGGKHKVKIRTEKPAKGHAAGIRTSARLLKDNKVLIGWSADQGFKVGAVGIQIIIPSGSDETSLASLAPVLLKLRSVKYGDSVTTSSSNGSYEIVLENPEVTGTAIVELAKTPSKLDAPMLQASLLHRRRQQADDT